MMASVKGQIKGAITSRGLLQLADRFVRPAVVILRYHSIQDEPGRHAHSIGSGIIHATSTFEKQMEIVARQFDPVSINDVLRFARGETDLPRRPVAITFDDGFADNFEIAAPILNRFGVPASFYITVRPVETGQPPWFCRLRHAFGTTREKTWRDSAENCARTLQDPVDKKTAFLVASARCASKAGEPQEQILRTMEQELGVEPLSAKLMMSWEQIRALYQSGHTIGSHTLTHPNVACLEPAEALWECSVSKDKLEEKLGARVVHFSYPSPYLEPHWTTQTIEVTTRVGYQTAVTCTPGPVRRGHNTLSLQRMTVPTEIHEFNWALQTALLGWHC
jgi:peptidoglycan/xylan/chitin deacetylase (PgdA/CDA1 family)